MDKETKEALLRSRPWAPTPEDDQHLSRAAATMSREGLALPADVARELLSGLTDLADRAASSARAARRSAPEA